MSRLRCTASCPVAPSASAKPSVAPVAFTLLLVAAAPLLAAGLSGCGTASGISSSVSSATSSETVARVGHAAIDRGEVEHWASAIKLGNAVATALGQVSGTPRERALKFLISSHWILGEAAERGLSISSAAVERGLRQKIDAMAGGRRELEEELSSTGQTLADLRLEVKASLAVRRIRDAVGRRAAPVGRAEVMSYYARHRRRFYVPERRVAYLIEGIYSYAHALALAKRVEPGRRHTRPWFRELVPKTSEVADRGTLAHMIFAARPGLVAGPKRFFGHWVLAVVTKLIPAGIQPLPAVKGELSKSLAGEHRERALKSFAAAYVRRWSARTSCSPGYLVRRCSGYRGTPAVEENPLIGG